MLTEQTAKPQAVPGAGIDRGPTPAGTGLGVGDEGWRGKGLRKLTFRTLRRLEAKRKREGRTGAWTAAAIKKERAEAGRGCEVCGWRLQAGDWRALQAHHVVPVKAGGTDVRENLMVLCPNHHAEAHRFGVLRRGGLWTGPTTREALFRAFAGAELRRESA